MPILALSYSLCRFELLGVMMQNWLGTERARALRFRRPARLVYLDDHDGKQCRARVIVSMSDRERR